MPPLHGRSPRAACPATLLFCLPPSPLCLAAVGIDDGQGILVRTVMEAGLGPKLKQHHVWRAGGLLDGAQLCVAGEQAAPLGGLTGGAKRVAARGKAPAARRAEVWDEGEEPLAACEQ